MPFPTDGESDAELAAAELAAWVRDTRKTVAAHANGVFTLA